MQIESKVTENNPNYAVISTELKQVVLNDEGLKTLATTLLAFIAKNNLNEKRIYHRVHVLGTESNSTNLFKLVRAQGDEDVKNYLDIISYTIAISGNQMVNYVVTALGQLFKITGVDFSATDNEKEADARLAKKINSDEVFKSKK